jgi:hypothetical protein
LLDHNAEMANLIYRCPHTALNVQAWMPDDEQPEAEQVYKAVLCSACTRLHFIHKSSGRLLGEPEAE